MKIKNILILSLVHFAAIAGGCGNSPNEPGDATVELTDISVSPISMELVYGGTPNSGQITAKPVPEGIADITFTYASEHPGIAVVSPTGLVTAKGVGATLITVTANGEKSEIVRITVVEDRSQYRNPINLNNIPDPTIIRSGDDFYLYCTEENRKLPIYRSSDLINWMYVRAAFSESGRPDFEPNGGVWAPDINFIDGKYVMYYSMSVWGGEWTCGIGVATAATPQGPFIDLGILFRSDGIGVQNSIDPNYVEDGGKKYLFWGSFRGIYGIELSDDGLSLKAGSEKRQVAGTSYEGVYIHKRGNYYYMFASIGSCCNGLSSTYTTVVGRSEDLWGPYLNKNSESMMNNKHEILIAKNNSFVGVGHNSEIVQDNAGNDWILYHGYSVGRGTGRHLFLDKVEWVDNWPVVSGGSPSIIASSPVF